MDLRLGWRNRDKGLVEGQPSMLGRARRERRLRGIQPQSEESLRDALPAPVSNGPPQPRDEAISTVSLGDDREVTAPLSADGEASASLSADSDPGFGDQNDEQAAPRPTEAGLSDGFAAGPEAEVSEGYPTPPEAEMSEEYRVPEGSIPDGPPESETGASVSTHVEGPQDPAAEESPAMARPEDRIPGPVTAQLSRLAAQLQGLQQQLDAFLARRGWGVAEQASQHVGAIVAAAEESAAEITASAKNDASALRERLLADVQAEVKRIRSDAQADARRIRTEAHVEAARLRERTIARATAEIDAFVARLAGDIQAAARASIAGIGDRPPAAAAAPAPGPASPPPSTAPAIPQAPPEVSPQAQAPSHEKPVADDVEEALDELQLAAAALEESLHHLRAGG